MADDQHRRRQKRLAKQKKKRENASRPGRDRASVPRAPSTSQGATWPVGECYLSTDWGTPGATVHAVFVRSHQDGRSVAAFVELDRSGPGVTAARVIGLPSPDHVLGECGRISEASDVGFQGAPPSLVAGFLLDAAEHGASAPRGFSEVEALLQGIVPDEVDPPFGPPPEAQQSPSLLSRVFGRLLG